ncbi:methyl-coenzyme M reductase operon protein D [Methanohalophilus sp.]|uniref:methyl-coenzyme M reductase operon protein D n=1 Tax=Methanohalophilus sp. TaxID=1966352 RepID=UPI002626DAEA|nr:methyl-coenzyme M reductase operon protein D [Methanohalophilus sp.]MDK2892671.1 methyl-coenzyme reductase subunit [Methanohalophilus sp.]
MTNSSSDNGNPFQIEIFPSRLVRPATAKELLNEISKIDGIIRAFIQGPRLPTEVPYGPAKGSVVNHGSREHVKVGDVDIELSIMVGRIRLEIEHEDVKIKLREVCERVLPFGFEIREGLFIPKKQTISDYAKRGPGADPKFLGLYDPKSKPDKQITILNSEENEA